MRGPFDNIQEDQGFSRTEATAHEGSARPHRKPPGGKALLRLLDLLESRGFGPVANVGQVSEVLLRALKGRQ